MKIAAMLVVPSLLLFTSCASSGRHEADRGVEGTLRSELDQRHVHVHVHHGIVTLKGHVRTEADRERIEYLVRNTSGVVAVNNKVRVTFPTPGTYGANPTAIPVYSTLPPEVIVPESPVTLPAPVVLPDYPKLKVQAWTSYDAPAATRIAQQLRTEPPPAGIEDVTITVRNGNVTLQGAVDTHDDRSLLIAAVERAGGVKAIYDQLQIK